MRETRSQRNSVSNPPLPNGQASRPRRVSRRQLNKPPETVKEVQSAPPATPAESSGSRSRRLSRRQQQLEPDGEIQMPPPPAEPSRSRRVARRQVQQKQQRPETQDPPQGPSKDVFANAKTAVVKLNRVAMATLPPARARVENRKISSSSSSSSSDEEPQQLQPQPPPAFRQNPFLPPRDLFPLQGASHVQQSQSLKELRIELLKIIGKIMNSVQDDEGGSATLENYDRIEHLYEYVDKVMDLEDVDYANKYRSTCVGALWQFGGIVWKQLGTGSNINPYMQRVSNFLKFCIIRLGWEQDREWRKKLKKWKWKMERWKRERVGPACYHAVKQFVRTHNDTNTTCRVNQLAVILELATIAHRSNDFEFLEVLFKHTFTCLMIRLKDKSNSVRSLAISILAKLIDVEGAEEPVLKQLKFFTRYDPCIEVRKIGTNALGRNNRTRVRYFFDQAFDKSPSVRAEAYRVLGMLSDNEEEGLIRDMDHLHAEKLCKLVVWGLDYSDTKCANLLKKEVLPNWLKYSCDNSLIKFLSNLDAYANMRAVLKIMDVMLTTGEQLRFVEDLDMSFIANVKRNILSKSYKDVTIEAMVGWLSLCKASKQIESIRPRVVPTGEEMLLLLQCLHECSFLEHDQSQFEGRTEDVSPLICTVLGMEIAKFVVWEEAGRRLLVKLLKDMLLDPVMDERILILQAMYKLHSCVSDPQEFEDIMMSIFQDVFDAHNSFTRRSSIEQRRRSCCIDRTPLQDRMARLSCKTDNDNPSEEMCFAAQAQDSKIEVETNRNGDESDLPESPPPPPVEEELPVRFTAFQLTKLREKLCDLALSRYNLTRRRDQLISDKQFSDAIPVNEEIMKIQREENMLQIQLKEQEELAKRPIQTPKPVQVVAPIIPSPPLPEEDELEDELLSPALSSENMQVDGEHSSDDEDGRGNNGVIRSIEDGLAKGIFMINTYMDLMPGQGLNPFFRNFYENYAPQFIMEEDVIVRIAIFQFLTRVAISDKRELKKVTNMLLTLLLKECENDIKNIAFKGLVDLIICYNYEDFVISEEEKIADDAATISRMADFTNHLQELVDPNLKYEHATSSDIAKMLMEALTKRFPPQDVSQNDSNSHERSLLLTTKNQGILKLLVAGYIRDPSVLAKVIMLWVNHDYSGTPILRDLENVLKLYSTMEWWGSGPGNVLEDYDDAEEDREYAVERTRILGLAIAEACLMLCFEGKGVEQESVVKFVGYMVAFLDHRDQSLMRSMSSTILSPVASNPPRSYNTTLVRAASCIPLTTMSSAKKIALKIDEIFKAMREHPMTSSLVSLKKEINLFLNKLKRVHGNDVLVVEGRHGKTRVVGVDFIWGDESFLETASENDSNEAQPDIEVFSESEGEE